MIIKKSKSNAFLWSVLTLAFCIGVLLFYNNNRSIFFAPTEEVVENESPNPFPVLSDTSSFIGLQKIKIKIDSAAYEQIKTKRDQALQTSILLSSDEDLVPAKIFHNNKSYDSKIRLKGDWTDHLFDEKWSFRVKLESEETLLGMRKFSLHHPRTRNYAWEWLFHQLVKDEGIINLQYHFTKLELEIDYETGTVVKDLGLYALEEAFEKYLIERNNRRESAILKINENPLWEERADWLSRNFELAEMNSFQLSTPENLPVVAFSEKKTLEDPVLYQRFKAGRDLFKGLMTGEMAIDEVFDIELLAKYNAICNILGGNHALIYHNYRVYYNPVTGLLEPVAFDSNGGEKSPYVYDYHNAGENTVFLKAYALALEKYASDAYIEKILNYPKLDSIIHIIQADIPDYNWQTDALKYNKAVIDKMVSPNRCLNVFYDGIEDDKIQITVENYGKFPVEVQGIKKKEGKYLTKANTIYLVEGCSRKTLFFDLSSGFNQAFTSVKKKKVGFSPVKDLVKTQLIYTTVGLKKERYENIFAWNGTATDLNELPVLKRSGNVKDCPFLVTNEKKKTITWKQGEWNLNQEVIIPKGYTFQILPNTTINLEYRIAKIISFSPIQFIGTEVAPIKFIAATDKGRGILVLNAQDTSWVENCIFDGLTNPKTNSWNVTGAINFYESPVSIKNSVIKNNHCEDALNVIRSWVELDNVLFSNTQSDAFDGDFVEGTIHNCLFGDLGNDAIDISGSSLIVTDVKIVRAKDKGLSAGENSTITAKNILIKDCEIAVASKDKSIITISDSSLKNNKLCFTAFQKKSEFGTARILATNITNENCELEYLIETNSSLELNGVTAETGEGVKGRMYGVDFGKKSE